MITFKFSQLYNLLKNNIHKLTYFNDDIVMTYYIFIANTY